MDSQDFLAALAPELAIALPPMLEADAELSEEQLDAVSGGDNRWWSDCFSQSGVTAFQCDVSGR